MTITTTHITTIGLILNETKAVEILDEILARNTDSRGRKPTFTTRQFLFLQFACAFAYKNVLVSSFPKALAELPAATLMEYGLKRKTSITSMYNYTKRLVNAVDYTETRAPHITSEERLWRRTKLDDYVETVLAYTIHRENTDPKTLSIDATAIEIGGRGATRNTQENETSPTPAMKGKGSKGPSDAAISRKTSTNGVGGSTVFFSGYFAHVLAFTPTEGNGRPDKVQTPFFTLETANKDVVEPSLRAIDRVQNRYGLKELIADRLYSYLEYERWWKEINNRGISQVLDLRDDQQGFEDFDGHLIAAGWVHCPATPLELGTIATLPPQPTAQQRMTFNNRIMERKPYAARRHATLENGAVQWKCPAVAGTVGCAIRGPESIQFAREKNRPIVANPPRTEDKPALCCNETILITPQTKEQKILFKTAQKHYWGSNQWQDLYKLRSSIERYFGHAKEHHGLKRDAHAFRGLGMATICTTAVFTSTNISKLRLWAATQQNPPQHPLLFTTEIETETEENQEEAI